MIHLLNTNLYRILRDRRLLRVIIFYVIICGMEFITPCLWSLIRYTGAGEGIIYHFKISAELSTSINVFNCFTAPDLLLVGLIYSTFLFADEKNDKVFENMCTIYKSRSKVFLANYISICSTFIIFPLAKLVFFLLLQFFYAHEFTLRFDGFSIPGYMLFVIIYSSYIALFYSLYIFTDNVYVPIVALFGPLTVTFCGRFMEEIPIGPQLYDGCQMFFFGLVVIARRIMTWGSALKPMCMLVVPSVVLLTISAIVVEKRDVR